MSADIFDLGTGEKVKRPRKRRATPRPPVDSMAELNRRIVEQSLPGIVARLDAAGKQLKEPAVQSRLIYDSIRAFETHIRWIEWALEGR